MIGLREQNYPTKELELFLFHYIKSNYGHKSVNEIFLAFDLAIKGLLDIDDYKCYENFSPEYFNRIMNGYRIFKNKTIKEKVADPVKEISYRLSQEDKMKELQEWENKDIEFDFIPIYVYDWLLEFGKVEKGIEDYVNRAVDLHKHNLFLEAEAGDVGEKRRYRQFLNMIEDGEIVYPEKLIVLQIIKKIKVFEYFKKIKQ